MPGLSNASLPRTTLVLGGARSGKSTYAESLLADHAGTRTYIATAEAGDPEMAERIAAHKARRGAGWLTVEQPLDVAAAIAANNEPQRAVLVDCLTLWLGNVMGASRDIGQETDLLLTALATYRGRAVLVSNEVGLGIVPDNALARAFRDHAGRLNQAVAKTVDHVVFVAAGLPMTLKP